MPRTTATNDAVTIYSSDDEKFYEIVNGHRIQPPPPSAIAARVTSRLMIQIDNFVEANQLGITIAYVLHRLPFADLYQRRPDISYVSFLRWPIDRPLPMDEDAWDVVPDLAVEVIGRRELAGEVMTKIADYFRAGVRQVWVVYPTERFVMVYESLTRMRGFTDADELDGGDILPGFRTPVAGLFPATIPEA